MRHPFETWPRRHRRPVFVGLLLLTVLTWAALAWFGIGTMTDEAPLGQVSLQMAGDRSDVVSMVRSWEAEGVMHRIGLHIGFDFVFLAVYSTALAAACAALAARCRWRNRTALPTAGVLLGHGAWVAGILDAAENASMVPLLSDPETAGSPELVRALALGKLALIVACLGYVLVAGIATWRDRGNLFSMSGPPP